MRPFLVLGDKGTVRTLKQAGFETFNEFFGIKHDDAAVDDIVKAVKSYNGDMATDYETLKSKLIHNRKRYFEFVDEQKNLI